jgi:cathepsin B
LSFLAIQIIGWGVDADTNKPYWLVVNSWNESWGEGGMFRIARGENECGIEGQIVAGLA